ncbi:MAG: M20 family metallopeptidase [Gemmataceae bacterium]
MNALEHTRALVSFDSVSRVSNVPVTEHVERALNKIGFETERIDFIDAKGVKKANVVGKKGKGSGGLAYFGHTDVVPADDWFSDKHGPFDPTEKEGKLYGRGSCDMKGSVACMLAAAERVSAAELKQPVYITCTADEEVGYGGARQVAERSQLFKEMLAGNTHGIIGEPTRLQVVYAHKGTMGFRATSLGRAAHSSTRNGKNANLAMIPFLVEMKAIHDELEADPAWQNAEFDPPGLSWNIGINDFTYAVNITAPHSICTVYFRPVPGVDPYVLIDRARRAAERAGIQFELLHEGPPLYVDPKSPFVKDMLAVTGNEAAHTVSYGTDGGIFRSLKNLVIYGPGDIAQAHTVDEWIDLKQLDLGTDMFGKLIQKWCL